jgi:hypothetical protein
MERAKFNITQQFNEAIQKWREAVDARDFEAAQFWARRADEFNTQRVAAENANRDVTRGQTLLSLGSRPETLGRYLYALQGQQVPQGFDFGTSALPGFGPNAQNPTVPPLGGGGVSGAGGTVIPTSGTASVAAAAPKPFTPEWEAQTNEQKVAQVKAAIADQNTYLGDYVAPGGTTITRENPNLPAVTLTAGQPATATQGPTQNQIDAQNELIAQGRKPRFYSNGVAVFGEGGVIPEPVIGRGQFSGLPYLFGEKGPETVRPTKKGDKQPKGDGTYQTGGIIGANRQGQSGWWDPGDATRPATFHPGPMPSVMNPPMDIQPTPMPRVVPSPPQPWMVPVKPPVQSPWDVQPTPMPRIVPDQRQPMIPPPKPRFPVGPNEPILRSPTEPTMWTGGTPPWIFDERTGGPNPNWQKPPQPGRVPGSAPGFYPTPPTGQPPPGVLPGLGGTGGMRGAATEQRSVFNPPDLLQYLSGEFLRPGIPNFPQYQQATGGTSLLSNARWLSRATPSELGLYQGFLRDEAGIPPEDALALAGRMAPRGGQLRTLGYGRTY